MASAELATIHVDVVYCPGTGLIDLVSLPMHGTVESLNVSVAAGVCLYEAVRQRRLAQAGGVR